MSESTSSGSSGFSIGKDLVRSWSELTEMISLRRQLAEAEIRSDVALARWVVVVGGIGLVVVLCGLPVLLVSLALQFENWIGADSHFWSIFLGIVLVVAGALTMWTVWQRFRHEFLGLRESLGELKEDLVWLREWVEDQKDSSNDDGDT